MEPAEDGIGGANNADLITSVDPEHPANLICTLCRNFYNLGWVTGTGGGTSIVKDSHIFIAPSGVQKELMRPEDIFVMDRFSHTYLRKPLDYKPSACTPLFLAAFDKGAGCCIHTHSQWAVLVTLLVEKYALQNGMSVKDSCFEIEQIEQIKGIPRGKNQQGMLGFFDRLRVPIIDNTACEEDLTESLEEAMAKFPDTYAVLVRRHGVYVWGDNVAKAKTQAESLDYIFRLAVEMRNLGLPWTKEEAKHQELSSKEGVKPNGRINGIVTPKRGRAESGSDDLEEIGGGTPRKRPSRPSRILEGSSTQIVVDGTKKRGRGRPRKNAKDSLYTIASVKTEVSRNKLNLDNVKAHPPNLRRVGRPKRETNPQESLDINHPNRRRPGRPRKTLE